MKKGVFVFSVSPPLLIVYSYLPHTTRTTSGMPDIIANDFLIYRLWTTTFDDRHVPLSKGKMECVLSRMLDAGDWHAGYFPHHPAMSDYALFKNMEARQ